MSVKDIKPKLSIVKDEKSRLLVSDVKPRLSLIDREQVAYTDYIMVEKGQSMGLLLALTYPVAQAIGASART